MKIIFVIFCNFNFLLYIAITNNNNKTKRTMTRSRLAFREIKTDFLSEDQRQDLYETFEKFYSGEYGEEFTSDDLPDSIYDDFTVNVISDLIAGINQALPVHQENQI